MKGPIQSLEISYLVHATEDEGKIESALVGQLGSAGQTEAQEMDGHFGNRIVKVTRHITGEEATSAFATLVLKMGPALKKRLSQEVERHLDEHSALYVRFDKQELVAGRLELGDSDPVRVRVKPRLYMVRGGARSLFLGLLS